MRALKWMCFSTLLMGCEKTNVIIEGLVLDGRGSLEGAAGVSVTLTERDFFPFSAATTDENGVFSLEAPRQSFVHLVVAADGDPPIAFAGESGVADVFVVPTGQLWSFAADEETRWREDFAGCPRVDEPGMIIGEVRLFPAGADVSDPNQTPIEIFGFAFITDVDGERLDACYLDDEGDGFDPDAERVGRTGRFAFFGVEGGPWTLSVGRETAGGTLVNASSVYVPEGGVVSRHPALVTL
jgi:hypothetical protein